MLGPYIWPPLLQKTNAKGRVQAKVLHEMLRGVQDQKALVRLLLQVNRGVQVRLLPQRAMSRRKVGVPKPEGVWRRLADGQQSTRKLHGEK